jgi:ribosomal protein L7/L12|tara:strand:+ start:1403 stop:1822 length:420 start_codon:yes stop_codon:yes gene_type:complete
MPFSEKRVKFSEERMSLGRNGSMKTKGVAITLNDDESTVTFEPINSKDMIGRAWIEMPVSAVPEFLNALSDLTDRGAKTVVYEGGTKKITSYDFQIIRNHVQQELKIKAIKHLRAVTGLGLKEAKGAVENPSNGFSPAK